MTRSALHVLVALAALPIPVAGQTLAGRVLDGDTRAPVAGALVELLGPDSSRVDAVLSSPRGDFAFEDGRRAGLTVRLRRIGYRTTTVALAPDVVSGARPLEVLLPIEALELEPLVATGRGRCQVDPRRGPETALLWDQARKALETAAFIHERELLRLQAVRFVRQLDPGRTALRDERLEVGVLSEPFRSPPADELARGGFVRQDGDDLVYYMPDARVTLSEEFLESHCFHVAVQTGPEGRLVGLAFEPLPGRGRPDVSGVLWLDAASAELRYLEYGYVGMVEEAEEIAGGRAELELLEGGEWIVRRWVIRMPILVEESRFLGLGTRRRLLGIREEGGEVLAAVTNEGRRVTRPGPYAVTGRVRDLDTGRPLAGAVVALSGTGRATTTDDDGTFRFEGLSRGSYLATFSHALLDTLGVYPRAQAFRLPDQREVLLLTPPSRTALMDEACPDVGRRGPGTLTGRVADAEGRPVEGAEVWLYRPPGGPPVRTHATKTDERGLFRFCGVPPGVPLLLRSELGDLRAAPVEVRVSEGGFARSDLTLVQEG